uniref:Uncharacterized protein n=2 Tax=Chenopodium quinoa TaxID=63459 RepID=A0A803KXG6_CHEQI
MFENALAELDVTSPDFYEKIMAIMPWKSLEQIKSHYGKLVADTAMIEQDETGGFGGDDNGAKVDRKPCRGAPWTKKEHRAFLEGLDMFGKGEWKSIAEIYVPTKTASQVASHGQKYYRRLKCRTPVEKRRSSIHDIRIVNSSIVETAPRQPTRHSVIQRIPQSDNRNNNNKQDDVVVGQHDSSNADPATALNSINNINSQIVVEDSLDDLDYDNLFADYDEIISDYNDIFI